MNFGPSALAWHTVFGGLVVMAAITIANMKRGVLLHKLILLEVCLDLFIR